MIKLFSLVVDLLQLPFSKEHLLLAEYLISQPNRKIISFYPYGFIFFAFQDMLLGNISQDQFVALGDSFGLLSSYQNVPLFSREALLYGLLYDPQTYTDSVILVSYNDKQYIEKSLPTLAAILQKNNSQIFGL